MTTLSTQLLVIGGGATGLGVAWDACLRGLKVVLIEQGDLAQGTSGRYHGLLHSGGRYVISDPPSARDCAAENVILRRLAPRAIEDTGGLFVAAPTDPADFPDRWFAACLDLGVPAEEITPAEVVRREPLLDPRLVRAFLVRDGSMDSFDLLHDLANAIRQAGGQVLLRHRAEQILVEGGRVTGVVVTSLATGETATIGTEMLVNASGPWSRQIAAMADVQLPIALGRGTMVAMATRLVNTVVNRLKPPSDGDIIVPVGTVAVLGTTDVPVADPRQLTIEPWEVDLLLAEGEVLIPGLSSHRALRAWAGIRPLYRPQLAGDKTRVLPRAHVILDHGERDGVDGLVSVIGGKLTTFRLMAQQTMDIVCGRLKVEAACRTAETPLEEPGHTYFTLPERWKRLEERKPQTPPTSGAAVICECELVTRQDLEAALQAADTRELDDVRRDLRLGMGPCQAGFCGYRATGIAHALSRPSTSLPWLGQFLEERWRGTRPVAWGSGLRQMEFTRRLYLELLEARGIPEERSQ